MSIRNIFAFVMAIVILGSLLLLLPRIIAVVFRILGFLILAFILIGVLLVILTIALGVFYALRK